MLPRLRTPAVVTFATFFFITGVVVSYLWTHDSKEIMLDGRHNRPQSGSLWSLANNAVDAPDKYSDTYNNGIPSTLVAFTQLEGDDVTDVQFGKSLDILFQKLCPLTTISKVALHLFSLSDHEDSTAMINQAQQTWCQDSAINLTFQFEVVTMDKLKDPYRFWQEVAFDWYLKDAKLFLFTAPTATNKRELGALVDRCLQLGASVASAGDLCIDVTHYEAFGSLFPVVENMSKIFPSYTVSKGWQRYEMSYHAWVPWLVCIYGNASLVEFIMPSNVCDGPEALASLPADRKRLERWYAAKRNQPAKPASNLKIISMSLYGNNPKYTYGAFRNAVLSRIHYPHWTLRIYKRGTEAGEKVIKKLASLGVELIDVASSVTVPPMMWRFLVADDPAVDLFIVRDSDSRIGERDVAVVEEWMKSNSTFHCIRDHPSHSKFSVSGGIWGAHRAPLHDILNDTLTHMTSGKSSKYLADMNLLGNVIWPKVKEIHAYCHDAYSCKKYQSSHPFPVARIGAEHLGQVFDRYDVPRAGDINTIKRTPVNKECSP